MCYTHNTPYIYIYIHIYIYTKDTENLCDGLTFFYLFSNTSCQREKRPSLFRHVNNSLLIIYAGQY